MPGPGAAISRPSAAVPGALPAALSRAPNERRCVFTVWHGMSRGSWCWAACSAGLWFCQETSGTAVGCPSSRLSSSPWVLSL